MFSNLWDLSSYIWVLASVLRLQYPSRAQNFEYLLYNVNHFLCVVATVQYKSNCLSRWMHCWMQIMPFRTWHWSSVRWTQQFSLSYSLSIYGTWHGKLNFFRRRPRGKSAYIRADNQRIPRGQSADSARTLRGFRTDNQRIPCGTISKFYSYNDISNDRCGVFLDLLALLRTKFAFWFPPFSNRIRKEDSCPSAQKIRARPHGRSASTRAEVPRRPRGSSAAHVRKIRVVLRGTTTEFLGKS